MGAFVIFFLLFSLMNSTLIQSMGLRKARSDCIQRKRALNRSVTVVTYVRWRCQKTTRLRIATMGLRKACSDCNNSRCVTVSHMILNRVIRRYKIIDCVVQSYLKYLMSSEKC
jgi:hypothetical protein